VRDIGGNGVSGTSVTFSAPTSGASGTFGGSPTVATDADGYAQAPNFTANGTVGSYVVTASIGSFSASFNLSNLQSCGAVSPFVVTANSDNGAAVNCGTLSRALLQASSGVTITFNLAGGTTLNLTGGLPPVRGGVTLDGGSCANPVTLDGTNTPTGTDGLLLNGGATVKNLRVTRFTGRQLVANEGRNNLQCVKALK
jgi:hypothetical protein